MTALLFLVVGVALIVVQTSVLPLVGIGLNRFDLLLPLMVFLGLQPRLRDGLAPVILIGLAVDSLSGAPPGYYTTAYFWIWVLVHWLIGFLRVAGTFMLPVALAGAVVVENLVLLGIPVLLGKSETMFTQAAGTVAWQVVWTVVMGALLVAGFTVAQRRLSRYQQQVQARRAVKE